MKKSELAMSNYYSGSQESEVCPMPYALCPMHVGYLMLLRKAIITKDCQSF